MGRADRVGGVYRHTQEWGQEGSVSVSLKQSPALVKERKARGAGFQVTERCPLDAGARARASLSIRPPGTPSIPPPTSATERLGDSPGTFVYNF